MSTKQTKGQKRAGGADSAPPAKRANQDGAQPKQQPPKQQQPKQQQSKQQPKQQQQQQKPQSAQQQQPRKHADKKQKKQEKAEPEKVEEVEATTEPAVELEPVKSDSSSWLNRQRTLIFCSRGVSYRARHLMLDLRTLMPHSKKESKLDRKDKIRESIPEICELRNSNNCIFFEMRKRQDLYMWVSKMNTGPSAKFLVENVHTMSELKFSGNTLRGSRPLLNFDQSFDTVPHLTVLKELFFQAFGTPRMHPKSKPFVDRVMSFFFLDNRIWVRNYEVISQTHHSFAFLNGMPCPPHSSLRYPRMECVLIERNALS
eukprot:m.286309 g.286309  ORF g.286309 m.286309 type:complete len:315 (-) comp54986_c0_seq5:200-1144(-)